MLFNSCIMFFPLEGVHLNYVVLKHTLGKMFGSSVSRLSTNKYFLSIFLMIAPRDTELILRPTKEPQQLLLAGSC